MTYDGSQFKRVNIIVQDLDRSLKIYRDILGFRLDLEEPSDETSYSYPVFKIDKNAKIRWALLSAGDEQKHTLAITEVKGMGFTPDQTPPLKSCIVIRCPKLDDAVGQLEAMGLEMVPEEKLVTSDGREGRELAFIDPDGHLVLVYNI